MNDKEALKEAKGTFDPYLTIAFEKVITALEENWTMDLCMIHDLASAVIREPEEIEVWNRKHLDPAYWKQRLSVHLVLHGCEDHPCVRKETIEKGIRGAS